MDKKLIKLKGDKIAYLSLQDISGACNIFARDENGTLIGECIFNFAYICSRPLTEHQRSMYAKLYKIPFEKTPKSIETKIVKNEPLNITHDKKAIIKNNHIYKINTTICELAYIDVLEKEYYKVGLGTQMFKEMEKIAFSENCDMIEALFIPYGEFQLSSKEFYKRHGFKFIEKCGLPYAIKTYSEKDVKIFNDIKEKTN